MSLYPPPTANVPVFNPALFTDVNGGASYGSIGVGNFVDYPTAQGAVTWTNGTSTSVLDSGSVTLSVINGTTLQGVGLNGDGIAYDDGTTIQGATWENLVTKVKAIGAITATSDPAVPPTQPKILNVNDTIQIQNGETATLPHTFVSLSADSNLLRMNLCQDGVTNQYGTAGQILTSGGSAGTMTWGSGGGGSVGTLQDVINNSPNLQSTAPTTSQVIQYNGANTVWATLPAESQNLQSVLNIGNTATGANATIALANSGTGDFANPQLSLTNTNATAGNNNGVPLILFSKTGRNGTQGDHIGTQSYFARNYLGTLKEFGRIECVITNTNAPAGDDGALDFYSCVNGTSSLVWRLNGADNENNSFRPLDMNGQDIKSSSGNMGISTASSSGTGNMTITAKGILTETGNSVAITSVGTAGDAITLTSAGNINLVPASGGGSTSIRTNSDIQTLSTAGGSKINFAGGNPDERFNIARNDMTLHWNNAITDTATITLENDITSLNSAINMTYTTGSGNLGTTIQNIPSTQRIIQTDGVNSKTAEYSPTKVELIDTLNGRTAKIENNVNSGENRMDLFLNSGGGVSAQSGIVNTAGTQMLYLTHTDNANNKACSLRQDTSGTGKLQYDNTIDSSAFEISSNNTDLKLSAPNTAGSGSNIEINPAGQLIFSSNLEASSSTGSSSKYLKIKLNGVNYCIPLDFA